MIKSERIAKKISDQISAWMKDRSKLIVAIDGYASAGKTTIADFIAKQNPDVLTVHLDDFIQHWKDRKQMIEKADDKSKIFEYNWYRYDDLEKLFKKFRNRNKGYLKLKTYDFDKNDFSSKKSFDLSKKILVIDGIFLFHPKHKISKLFDKKIYLNIDFIKADKKRIAREKKKWGKSYIPENHPDNWTKYFKIAYRRYVKNYKPQDRADIIFDI